MFLESISYMHLIDININLCLYVIKQSVTMEVLYAEGFRILYNI